MKRSYFSVGCFVIVTLLLAAVVGAADWPQFRGPSGDGKSSEKPVPTKWSAKENIHWKTPMPQPGNGSPIVVGNRVYVTSAEDNDGMRRSLLCLDAETGKQLWVRTVEMEKKMPTHQTNPYCGTTPVCDGERVVVWHATGGLHCYDTEGKELWKRDLGAFRHTWGYGSSPILYKGNVILHTGPGQKVSVLAISIATGKTIWEQQEPVENDGDRNDGGKYMGSWCTPIVTTVDGRDQLINALSTRINAYDPETGKIIWSCSGVRHDRGDLAYSSPMVVGDICFFTGGFRGPAMAIRINDAQGDVTETHRLWRTENQPQSIGTGVAVDGYVYRPNAGPGTIQCIEPKTGQVKWTDRGASGNLWASIVMAGGLLYATNQGGTTVVFKPNPEKYEEVAKNQLGDRCNATPAIANKRLYFRTNQHLVCIGSE